MMYDYDAAIITSVAACCNSSFILFPHNPYNHAVTSLESIQFKANHAPIITVFQLNCSTPRWSHKHCFSHNGKCTKDTFTQHLDNQKWKVKLFPISKHTWNLGLHWGLWKKQHTQKVIIWKSECIKQSSLYHARMMCFGFHEMSAFSIKAVPYLCNKDSRSIQSNWMTWKQTILSFVLCALLSYCLLQLLLLSWLGSCQVSPINTRLSKQHLPTEVTMIFKGQNLPYL